MSWEYKLKKEYDDYRAKGFQPLLQYHGRKVYTGYTVDEFEFEGKIYCPKKSSEQVDRSDCNLCIYHHGQIKDHLSDKFRIICGFKAGLERENN